MYVFIKFNDSCEVDGIFSRYNSNNEMTLAYSVNHFWVHYWLTAANIISGHYS